MTKPTKIVIIAMLLASILIAGWAFFKNATQINVGPATTMTIPNEPDQNNVVDEDAIILDK